MVEEEKKDIEETLAEKNAEERESEAERGGAEHRTQPSDEKKDKAIESITKDIPPNKEKVNLLNKAKNVFKTKSKSTTNVTKKGDESERVPEKDNTESEVVKQSKVRNKKGNIKKHAFNDDGICLRCGVGNKEGSTTTDCFGRHLPVVTAQKVKDGLVDFHNGAWKMRKLEDEAKDDEDTDADNGDNEEEEE